jgi:EAL domain-containing protein (putative c-di-GMP-specific phosphodiesterase class I)
VVAEGIETEAELAAVCALGADLAQGWYLGRPAGEAVAVDPRLVLDAAVTPARKAAGRRAHALA